MSVVGRYVYTWVNRASLLKLVYFAVQPHLITKCSKGTRGIQVHKHETLPLMRLTCHCHRTQPPSQESPILLDRRNHCTTSFGMKVLTLPCGSFVCESSPNCLGAQFGFLLMNVCWQEEKYCSLPWAFIHERYTGWWDCLEWGCTQGGRQLTGMQSSINNSLTRGVCLPRSILSSLNLT